MDHPAESVAMKPVILTKLSTILTRGFLLTIMVSYCISSTLEEIVIPYIDYQTPYFDAITTINIRRTTADGNTEIVPIPCKHVIIKVSMFVIVASSLILLELLWNLWRKNKNTADL
jgi:hypothetical protein